MIVPTHPLREKVRNLARDDQLLSQYQQQRRGEMSKAQWQTLDDTITRLLCLISNLEHQIDGWTGSRWRERR